MTLETWEWGLMVVAALSMGLAKSGFSGVSLIAVFIFTEIFGAREQVGVALPMLIVADFIVFPAFVKHGNWREVWILLPPTVIGGGVAFYILQSVDNAVMRPIVGIVILLMVFMQLARKWKPDAVYTFAMTKGFGIFAGLAGGMATVLANAAGPVQQLYLLSKRMDKMDLIGVGARFFLIVNLLKVPLLSDLELVTSETLKMNLYMLPALVVGVFSGKKILHLVPQKVFENFIVIFAFVASVKLIFF